MISRYESSVNNWWESDGPMKEFTKVMNLMNHNRKSSKKQKESLAPTEGQMVMPKICYTMIAHGFQEILIVWIGCTGI